MLVCNLSYINNALIKSNYSQVYPLTMTKDKIIRLENKWAELLKDPNRMPSIFSFEGLGL